MVGVDGVVDGRVVVVVCSSRWKVRADLAKFAHQRTMFVQRSDAFVAAAQAHRARLRQCALGSKMTSYPVYSISLADHPNRALLHVSL